MSGRFKKATRKQVRLRFALDGPAGSGKSYTMLRFAFAFPGARVACIEAGEPGGLSLYLGESPDGVPFEFDILELRDNYAPSEYTAAIEEAGRNKYDILVIDSLSHAWSGSGGALDQVGNAGFTDKDGWKKVTPQHNRMIESILQSPCHVLVTMRSKTEYVIEDQTNREGKTVKVPKKIGMAPVQRAGMEYEFTVYGSIDWSHVMTITKSRCSAIQDAIVMKPGAPFMDPLMRWLETGEVVEMPEIQKRVGDEQIARINDSLKTMNVSPEGLRKALLPYGAARLQDLLTGQADEIEAKLKEKLAAKAAKAAKESAVPVEAPVTSNGTVEEKV